MKYIYCIIALFLSGEVIAQSRLAGKAVYVGSALPAHHLQTQIQAAFFSEDFESVTVPALPAGWSTSSNESGFGGFYTGTSLDANAGGYWPVTSHTTFVMTNDDACTPGGNPPTNGNNCDLSNEVLQLPNQDFSNQSGLGLSFDMWHDMSYGGGDAIVEVSTDSSATWTVAAIYTVTDAAAQWQSKTVNLSAYDSMPSVDIRFRWSDNGNWATGLALDNISIDTLPNFKLTLIKGLIEQPGEMEYTIIPLSQSAVNPLEPGLILSNSGAKELTGLRSYASIVFNSGATVFTDSSSAITLLPDVTDTLFTAGSYTAGVQGFYDFTCWAKGDSVIDTTWQYRNIEVSDSVYALDESTYTGQGIWNTSGCAYVAGNIYKIDNQAMLSSVSFYLQANTNVTNSAVMVYPVVYEKTSSGFNLQGQGPDYTIQGADIASGFRTISMGSPDTLPGGKTYLIGIGYYGSSSPEELLIATSGIAQQGSSWLLDIPDCQNGGTNTWYELNRVPMLRANLQSSCTGMNISTSTTDANCGVADGTATVTVTGGNAPYSYLWNIGMQISPTATGLQAGTYNCTVSDSLGCAYYVSAMVSNPPGSPVVTVTPTDISCYGACDGIIQTTVSGGATPYTYTWDDPMFQIDSAATGLCRGTYNLTVSDTLGCMGFATGSVVMPQKIISNTNADSCAGSSSGNDGQATVFVSGGTPPYSYLWDDGETSVTATALSAGTHFVTITDGNGCLALDSAQICITGIAGLKIPDLKIYPNPTTGAIYLTGHLLQEKSYELVVKDLAGRNIQNQIIDVNVSKTAIKLSSLSAGVYIILVADGTSEVWRGRIMVIK